MTPHALAAHLIDFSAPRRRAVTSCASIRDVDAEIAEVRAVAYREGFAAGCASTEAACATEMLATDVRAQHRLAIAREVWSDEIADLLAVRLDRQLREGFNEIADAVARVLAALAIDAQTPAALDMLARRAMETLRNAPVARVAISGPEDLLTKMEDRLPEITFVARTIVDTTDVSLQIDETLFKTQLGSWHAALREAFEVAE